MVTTSQQLDLAVDAIRTEGSFAYDTEFIGESTYIPKLCLIQLATKSTLWLVDPFQLENEDCRAIAAQCRHVASHSALLELMADQALTWPLAARQQHLPTITMEGVTDLVRATGIPWESSGLP